MAKGFGSSQQGYLGYVLLLIPEARAYAADLSLEGDDQEFIGLTNMLENAQVWKKKAHVKQAVVKYIDLLIEELENYSQVEVSIRKIKRLSNGKLKDEPEEDLIFGKISSQSQRSDDFVIYSLSQKK